jgi:hypothetical protein
MQKRSDYSMHYKEKYDTIHKEFIDKILKTELEAPIFGKFNQLDNYGDRVNFAEAYHLNEIGQVKYSKLFYELSQKEITPFSKQYSWFQN